MNTSNQNDVSIQSVEIERTAAQLEKMAREIDATHPNFAFRLDNLVMKLQRIAEEIDDLIFWGR